MMEIVKSRESDLLNLQIVANPKGEATPNTTVGWSISDELIDQIKEREFQDPHLLLFVASRHRNYHSATKAYSIPLLKAVSAPKKYISFSRPGENIVIATIVDTPNSVEAGAIQQIVNGADVRIGPDGEIHWDGYLKGVPNLGIQASQGVTVDSELFAPDPPKWLKKCVKFFFRTSEFDQCHFRRRAIASLLLMIPVQLYGIFARLFSLVFALFLGRRGMSVRSFFALHPHDFHRELGNSFWIEDKEGNERPMTNPLWYINPVSFAVYAFVLIVLALPGILYLSLFSPMPDETPFLEQVGTIAKASAIIDPILALIIFFVWLNLSRTGRETAKEWMTKLSRPAQPTPYLYESLGQHKIRQITKPEDVLQVPDTTIALRFNALKAKVCRPFAR